MINDYQDFIPSETPDAPVLSCPTCTGPVPILDQRGAQCLFCLRAVPVPADSRPPLVGHTRLKRALTPQLAEIRGARPARTWLLFAGSALLAAGGAGLAFATSTREIPAAVVARITRPELAELLLVGGGATLVVLLLLGVVAATVRRRWKVASIPYARVYAGDGLGVGCSRCSAVLPVGSGAMVERCRECGADNLIPAPLVKRRAREQYKQVIRNRLETSSPNAAAAVAHSHGAEWLGWAVLGVGALSVIGWAFLGPVVASAELLADPVVRVAAPAFLGVLFGGFGLHSIVTARLARRRLLCRTGPARRY